MQITAPIVGARFRPPASDVLNNLPGEQELLVLREPDNKFDVNALQVLVKESDIPAVILEDPELADQIELQAHENTNYLHLGFVPAKIAVDVAPVMDACETPSAVAKLMFDVEGRPVVEFELAGTSEELPMSERHPDDPGMSG